MTAASYDGCCAPGAAPIGSVLDLAPLEMQVVIYLRLWCGGERGRMEVWQDLRARIGAENGRAALLALERFFLGLTDAARRPLQRHGLECPCLGGDEAALARIVGLAAAGDREEAAVILSWLVSPAVADDLAGLAEAAGLHLASSCLPPSMSAPCSDRTGPQRRKPKWRTT